MSGERRKQLLDESKPSRAFEFVVAGAILLTVVLLFTLDLGLDLKQGFERFGGGTGEVDGPQARGWGVAEPDFADALALPPTGVLARRRSAPPVAALVTLLPHKGAPHAYVKLVGAVSGELELTAFVRSGDSLDVSLAPDVYELRYALGETWFGGGDLFGAATRFAVVREDIDLRADGVRGADSEPRSFDFPRLLDGDEKDRPLLRRDF